MRKELRKKRASREVNTNIERKEINKRLIEASDMSIEELYEKYETSKNGKTPLEVKKAHEQYGDNKITYKKGDTALKRLARAFINPFSLILITLAIVSFLTDVVFATPNEKNPTTVIIIITMIMLSGVLRFVQETRSGNSAEKLLEMIETTCLIERTQEGSAEIPLDEVVVGDLVHLSAGDMIPADVRIIKTKDLFISQAALTGESQTVEKFADDTTHGESILDRSNLAFMGTNIISGSADGVVIATGDETIFGDVAKELNKEKVVTSFERGVNTVSLILIKFMIIMVPIVFFINGFTKGHWLEALLFSISIAVGLTPEMLPMIVTTTLAKGSVKMSKEKVIIKNLNSIQNLGSINILCTDKTGTLTEDNVVLQYHLNVDGENDTRVLRHGFLNSYYQTGLKNLMDKAIISRTMELREKDENLEADITKYEKLDEVPFDFQRRRMSVIVKGKSGKTKMITKGAVEEILSISSYIEHNGEVVPLTDELKKYVMKKVTELNSQGMRVIAVAQKTSHSPVGQFSVADEKDMVLLGYLAFLDPPKKSATRAIETLQAHGVEVKVLTGDNEEVTMSICKKVGIKFNKVYTGAEIAQMSDKELSDVAYYNSVFAKLSPSEKARIVNLLRERGNSVGYMGDGINDAASLEASDVGISVSNAVDIAKESADVILLEKDLMVLETGIIEGRKTYANMMKYIKMTASSNFGNVFSVLVASTFLPFLPMEPIHLLLLNLIYDISCIALPWDNVDSEYLKTPREWDASSVSKIMIWIGPISSIFDIITYALMYFVIAPMFTGGLLFHNITDPKMIATYIAIFQAGWFVESMWSQSLVIHTIRTAKIPFVQSRASLQLTTLTLLGIAVSTIIPFSFFGSSIGLAPLPKIYFLYLAAIITCYIALVNFVKKLYIKKYKELL